jgi:hypothetical protein
MSIIILNTISLQLKTTITREMNINGENTQLYYVLATEAH